MTPLQGARRVVKQNITELQISISEAEEDFRCLLPVQFLIRYSLGEKLKELVIQMIVG